MDKEPLHYLLDLDIESITEISYDTALKGSFDKIPLMHH